MRQAASMHGRTSLGLVCLFNPLAFTTDARRSTCALCKPADRSRSDVTRGRHRYQRHRHSLARRCIYKRSCRCTDSSQSARPSRSVHSKCLHLVRWPFTLISLFVHCKCRPPCATRLPDFCSFQARSGLYEHSWMLSRNVRIPKEVLIFPLREL